MIDMKITKLFFDKKVVRGKVDAGTRKVLDKFGSFVRRTAQYSIKNAPFLVRKKRGQKRTDLRRVASKPGDPPHSRKGLLKKFIFFRYDPSQRSEVIGPEKLPGKGEAPSLLEYGGTTKVKSFGRRVTAKYEERPFMGPAFEKEQPKLPAMWSGSIK